MGVLETVYGGDKGAFVTDIRQGYPVTGKAPSPSNGHPSTDENDPFPYGWRVVEEIGADGEISEHVIPLTLDDFLDPQFGDQMPQGYEHIKIMTELYIKFDNFFVNQRETLVLADVKILWRIPGLKEPFPDIAIIHGVQNPGRIEGSFDCAKHGVRPSLIIEVTSPKYEAKDREKIDIYQQAGIEEYIIINPHVNQPNKPMTLTGYRLHGGVYQPIQPDSQGRLLSQTTGVLIGLTETDKYTVEVSDVVTGERLFDHRTEKSARVAAQTQAKIEAQRAEEESRRAEEESRRAEEESRRAEEESRRAEEESRRAKVEAQRAGEERLARLQAESQLRQTILTMQANGLSLDTISELTGLPVEQLEQLTTT